MPYAPRHRRARKPHRKGRKPHRAGMGKGKRMPRLKPTNYAVITETSTATPFNSNTAYNERFNIQQFPRALEVAKGFKYYRLKRVEYVYTPEFNTFQEGSTGVKPYFNWVMNRTGDLTYGTSLASLRAQGAVPQQFTTMKKISYMPNNCQALSLAVRQSGQSDGFASLGSTPVFKRWFATQQPIAQSNIDNSVYATEPVINNPSYFGHDWYVSQDGSTSINIGSLVVHATWEFKEPQDQLVPTS